MVPLPLIMEPNPLDELTTENGNQQILIDGQPAQISTGFGNQIIMLQPPSSSSKVIGILLVIWGVLNSVFLLLAIIGWSSQELREEQGIDGLAIALNLISGVISISNIEK